MKSHPDSTLWHGRNTPVGFPGYDVAKAGIRMTTRLASLAETDGIRVNCLAPGWIATNDVQEYWKSLTPTQRAERGVPSRLLTTDQVSDTVARIAEEPLIDGCSCGGPKRRLALLFGATEAIATSLSSDRRFHSED